MHLLSSTNLMLLHLLLFTSPCPPFIFTPYPHSSQHTNTHLPIIFHILSYFCMIRIEMEKGKSKQVSLLMWVLVAGLFFQNLVIPVTSASFEGQKNYYPSPDPHSGTPPSGSHGTPSHGSGGSYGGSPPSHGSGTPSHGGGYHPTPTPTPSTPSGGNCGTPPVEPSTPSTPTPSHHHSPPTYSPPTYSPPTYGGSPPSGSDSPPTPVYVSPPIVPVDPGTPSIPSPPFFPAPTPSIGGTCDFWRNHPTLIWGVLGWWGTVGSLFGIPTSSTPGFSSSIPGFSPTMSIPQALSNTRTDGFGALYREGTASLLNSMVNNRFPLSTKQVRESFVSALGSNRAAASQAHVFKLANEGHLKPRA